LFDEDGGGFGFEDDSSISIFVEVVGSLMKKESIRKRRRIKQLVTVIHGRFLVMSGQQRGWMVILDRANGYHVASVAKSKKVDPPKIEPLPCATTSYFTMLASRWKGEIGQKNKFMCAKEELE